MDIHFMGMAAEIPEGWEDRSTITFQIPAAEGLVAPLAAKSIARSPGNVVINWLSAEAPNAAEAHIDHQLKSLPGVMEAFKLLRRGDLGSTKEPLHFLEYTFIAMGQALQQILCVRLLDPRIVVVTGTAVAAQFPAHRPRFLEIARSIKQASTGARLG